MSELKNCPFCPDGVGILKDRYVQGTANRKTYWVECNKCQARIQNRRSAKRAVEAWNADYRRAQPENEPIVRCGEYRRYAPPVVSRDTGVCTRVDRLTEITDYCSYGAKLEDKPCE